MGMRSAWRSATGLAADVTPAPGSGVVVMLGGTGGNGASSDIDGVASGRARSGDPVSRYCGPLAKLVSCAAEYPVTRVRRQRRAEMRMKASGVTALAKLWRKKAGIASPD